MKLPQYNDDNNGSNDQDTPFNDTAQSFAIELTEVVSTAGLVQAYKTSAAQLHKVICDLKLAADSYRRMADAWEGFHSPEPVADLTDISVPEMVTFARSVLERQLFVLSVAEGMHQL